MNDRGPASPVTGFSHVQLLVGDVARSQEWYSTVLGVVPMTSGDGYVALRHPAGGFVIVLTERESGLGPSADDLDHLAFAVPDGETLQAWAGHLLDVGIENAGPVLELGMPSLQLRDPDGTAIELVAPPPR